MSNFPEIGYTPANLRHLIESKGWTQKQFAQAMGVSELAVRQWLMSVETKSHRDMSHKNWLLASDSKENIEPSGK